MGACACQNKEDENTQVEFEDKVLIKETKSYAANARDLDKYNEDEGKIVKIQASYRGFKARKGLKNPKFDQTKLIQEDGLEFREEHTFDNGAVYKGQWRGE